MTETFLDNYFEGVATNLKDIGHTPDTQAFYRMAEPMDLEEFENAVKSMTKDACLLLEIGSGNMGSGDSFNDTPAIGLHVLIKTTEVYADIRAARDQAKAILLKIVARIRFDSLDKYNRQNIVGGELGDDGPLKAIKNFFESKIKFANMSAVDGNWYGKSFYFNFSAPVANVYNPNDWTA